MKKVFTIKVVQNGFKVEVAGKEFVYENHRNILESSIDAIHVTLSELKPGDTFVINLEAERK